ncbi:MAG TPA: hypothetical protein VHC67_10255 [Gaiellaceae bacterium]|jgi:hypothetical protein|nr:hypothetical protein [Gaiellaceae bacterium]
MGFGLRAVGSACRQVFSHLTLSFGGNVLAMLLSLPIVLALFVTAFAVHSLTVVPLGTAVLLGVLPNPACLGLQTIARELAHGHGAAFGEQWDAFRAHWQVALRAWLIGAAVTIVLAANVVFYAAQITNQASRLHAVATPLFLVWALLLLFWLGINLYVAPLLLAQVEPRALLAYRNAVVLTVSRPVASWTVVVLWLGVLVFTSATALASVVGLALSAAVQQNAFRRLLPDALPARG